jgi:hypothetical protein
MTSTSVPATASVERTIPFPVLLDCTHEIEIEVPAGGTNCANREAVRRIDDAVKAHRWGLATCPTCASSTDERTTDARDLKARRLMRTAGQWLKVRDRRTGRPVAYGVPSASMPGVWHLTNGRSCTCPDAQRRGQWCYHARAVTLHVERIRAARATVAKAA